MVGLAKWQSNTSHSTAGTSRDQIKNREIFAEIKIKRNKPATLVKQLGVPVDPAGDFTKELHRRIKQNKDLASWGVLALKHLIRHTREQTLTGI
eukprot:1267205-Ditylum_brightwellii.AAC.1